MYIKRREFLRRGIGAGAGILLASPICAASGFAQVTHPDIEVEEPLSPPPFDVGILPHFVDALPIPAVARPQGLREAPNNLGQKIPYYKIAMREFQSKVHRDLHPTRMWGYESSVPGPTFDVRAGHDFFVEWVNQLPPHHLLAVDTQLHGAEDDKPMVRTVVHVHGARVSAESDGYPESWFTPGKSALYYYPNRQDAATLWYHDHALGITRLNIFAGLFGTLLIRDEVEDALNLPSGNYEIPLAICDRSFDRNGQLDYPIGPQFRHPWVPEFVGNAILINGRLFPYLTVEPRRYRFRIVNASNGKILRLSFSGDRPFHQIGGDLSLLDAPIELRSLVLAPAERADLVMDFAGLAGAQVTLKNDDRDAMQFRVSSAAAADSSSMPPRLRTIKRILPSEAIKTRTLTLDEDVDQNGRVLRSLLNGTRWSAPATETPVLGTTEIWELINLTKDAHPIHLHASHFQVLDRRPFDVMARQRSGALNYSGPARPADPGETGWKDTVRVNPGTVTRIIVRFDGFAGRYSWHCHILEHEDNEMMRPLEILASSHRAIHRRHH